MDNLIEIKAAWTFRFNMKYLNITVGFTMTNEKFDELFRVPGVK